MGRRLTPLQRTLLRWLELVGPVRRTSVMGWTKWGGVPRRELVERWMLPTSIELGSPLRCFDDQVRAMRLLRYVRTVRGELTLTDRGSEALHGA